MGVNDLHNKNYSSLRIKDEKDVRKWEDVSCFWAGKTNIVKIVVLLKLMYRSNAIPMK